MRSKIVGRIALKIVSLATIFFLSAFQGRLDAQTLPPEVTALVEQLSDDPAAQEALLERYESLVRRRPDINTLSRAEMEETRLLTLFQIESILDHRKEFGDILSVGELALVDGFSPEKAAFCAQFFSFGNSHLPGAPPEARHWHHDALLRSRWKVGESVPSLTGKATVSSSRVTFAATLDHDAGEPWQKGFLPDFVSLSAGWNGRRGAVVKQAVAGDFTARFGQGLVLWKSFRAGALLGEPAAVLRHSGGLKPYTSTDESNFFRGAGVTLALASWQVTFLASYNAVDARLSGDSYTSIATDGLHRTDTECAKRHSMHEWVTGLALGREFPRGRIGLTAAAYRYDKANGRRVYDYNRYQQYDGWWGNLGVDGYWHSQQWRIFGEAAVDAHGAPAAVAGAVWSPVYALETSLLLRYYDKSYIATHANAYSTLSACANQLGATLSLRYYLDKVWTLRAHGEYSYYPWIRYGYEGPSSAWRIRLEMAGAFANGSSAQLIFRNNSGRWQARLGGSWSLSEHWSLGARAQGGPGGGAAFAEAAFSGFRHRLRVAGRVTYYETADWDSRVSFYEKGLPQSYSARQFYGKGTGAYLLVRYAPVKGLEGWVRFSDDYCAFLIRSFMPG